MRCSLLVCIAVFRLNSVSVVRGGMGRCGAYKLTHKALNVRACGDVWGVGVVGICQNT